jgi:hypothetical protein
MLPSQLSLSLSPLPSSLHRRSSPASAGRDRRSCSYNEGETETSPSDDKRERGKRETRKLKVLICDFFFFFLQALLFRFDDQSQLPLDLLQRLRGFGKRRRL